MHKTQFKYQKNTQREERKSNILTFGALATITCICTLGFHYGWKNNTQIEERKIEQYKQWIIEQQPQHTFKEIYNMLNQPFPNSHQHGLSER